MSFSVDMQVDQISVEAGSTAPINFTIKNEGVEADQFEVQIEGLDPEWTAIANPMVAVNGSAQQAEKAFFKPPRVSESQAGAYPFALKVRSMASGESKSVQGVLEIKPFHYLSMEVAPKRGVFSPTKKENVFEATIMNLGNSEHSLQIFGNDPEDALSFAFSHEQIVIGPGQTRQIEATVTPTSSRLFSTSKLHGISIGARSIDTPSVACSSQAQLEQKALMTPGMVTLGIFVIALFIGWLALLPKPPEMEFLRLSRNKAFVGDTIKISWNATNADRVRIHLGTDNLVISPDIFGSYEFTAKESGTIQAVATMGGKSSSALYEQLTVEPRPVVPEPKISNFSISPRTANKGDKLTVRYVVDPSVVKLTLSPPGQVLDPKIDTIFISADVVGTITYKLVAENSEGKIVTDSVTVTVVDPTLPRVDEFKSTPALIEADSGMVTLSWRTTNATRIEILGGEEKYEATDTIGIRDFIISKTTEFTLNAYDAQNRKTVKKLRVEVKPAPVIDPGDPTSTTGGRIPTTTGGEG